MGFGVSLVVGGALIRSLLPPPEDDFGMNPQGIGTGLMVAGGVFFAGGVTSTVLGFRTADRAMDYELATGLKVAAAPGNIWLIATLGGLVIGIGPAGVGTGVISAAIYQKRFNEKIKPHRLRQRQRASLVLLPRVREGELGVNLGGRF